MDFEKAMAERTNTELLKILKDQRDDYQPEAVKAAEKELAKRDLSQEDVSSATQELEEKKQFDEKRANEPLGSGWKVLTAIFPGLLQIMFSGTFKSDGYDRKARELVRWTLYGFGFYFGLVVLIIILGKVL